MNRAEAKKLLDMGIKIKHRHFSKDEWIQKVHGTVYSEEGYDFTGWWDKEGKGLGEEGWDIYAGD